MTEEAKQRTVPALEKLRPGESRKRMVARASIDPALHTMATLDLVNERFIKEVDLFELTAELEAQAEAVKGRDLGELEAVLACNVKTLDIAFHQLLRTAFHNFQKPALLDQYMKLALRAQNQSRMTAETISRIQNPPTLAIVGQANIANGPQQVNNGAAPVRARETEIQRTELLEESSGQRLDTRAPSTAGRADPELETVGAIDRAAH